MFFSWPLSSVTLFICLVTFASGATLVPSEVEALKQIAKTLGKTNWNFSVDPCSGQSGWVSNPQVDGTENAVTCTCPPNGTCHVTSIVLKSQSLPGKLPPELAKLQYLLDINLTRNYLSGTIPPEWGTMQLRNISLVGNRLTGPIPAAIANITTLVKLTLEFNQLSGAIPSELGILINLEKLHLTSNKFSGELPGTLANLTTLKDFRIGDNHFKGKIPSFIENWTNLDKLVIQASGLDGPFPPGIALLTKMTDMRISDLNGIESRFPPLWNMENLQTLILRSCNIVGQLPSYLGNLTKLNVFYLTGNLLSGPVPDWMLTGKGKIDLSFNYFTDGNTALSCQQGNVNLYGNLPSLNATGTVSCLGSFDCPRNLSYLHINCGGRAVPDGRNTYEDDRNPGNNWGFSSTGHFLDNRTTADKYIWHNSSSLSANTSKLYMDARLSPLSLTYYVICLLNGNYTVDLHFAEIVFTDDRTYSSLGRRIFDIYIQGNLVLKDFNIEAEAGGVGKAIIKRFTAVVSNNTLEIRFYWAGKGTTGIPYKGVYGPLISAISIVNPDIIPPPENLPSENGNSISAGTMTGIVVGVAFGIFLVLGILWWKGCLRPKDTMAQDLKGLDDLYIGSFTLRQIKAATNNFDASNKIGEGGFGSVYMGLLADGTIIAVKQLSSKSKQGNREFVNEIGMISALQHPHLVKLYGCCIEGNQLLLVYEYMENHNLARALFGPEECQLKLDWRTRHKICIGIARGLAYLHEESRLKIVHRDIKASNVLLDKDLTPKISDFGLAKLDEEENTHISTRVAGTIGYMAPEYAMRGYLTDKADVYSFGIVALEIVSGRSCTSRRTKDQCFYLLDWALVLKEKGYLMELVDPRLGSDFNEEEVMTMINVALLCANALPEVRPTMSSVVSILEGKTFVQEIVSDPPEETSHHQHFQATNVTKSQRLKFRVGRIFWRWKRFIRVQKRFDPFQE